MNPNLHTRSRRVVAPGAIVFVLCGLLAAIAAPAAQASARKHKLDPSFHANIRNFLGGSTKGNVSYHDGPTIGHVKVVGVVWGIGTYLPEVQTAPAPNVSSFTSNLVDSPFMDLLSEYSASNGNDFSIHRGSLEGMHTITPAASNNQSGACNTAPVDDTANIQPELAAQLDASALPAPDADTLYVLFFHQGQCITDSGATSLNDFCAYHGAMDYNSTRVRYAVMPYDGANTGCGNTPGFGNFSSVMSHEVAEAITDPDPGTGWNDGFQEIADICNHVNKKVKGADGFKYVEQAVWSQAQRKCTVTGDPRFVSVGQSSIVEGDSGQRALEVPITLSTPRTAGSLLVTYDITDVAVGGADAATEGVDYIDPGAGFGVIGWNPLSNKADKKTVTKFISIPIIGDTDAENTETFQISLHVSTGFGVGRGTSTETILDDDSGPSNTLSVGNGGAVVGASGNGLLSIPVTLSDAAGGPVTVHFAVTPGTATTKDYKVAKTGTLTIPSGQTSTSLVVAVKTPKVAPSTDKSFAVTLSAPTGAVLGRSTGAGTLLAP